MKKPKYEKYKGIKWMFSYNCPICYWMPPEDLQRYIIKRGKCYIITNYWKPYYEDGVYKGEEENKEITKHVKRQIYPITKNGRTYSNTVMGIGGQSWDEVHKCPNCNKEWEFDNANF